MIYEPSDEDPSDLSDQKQHKLEIIESMFMKNDDFFHVSRLRADTQRIVLKLLDITKMRLFHFRENPFFDFVCSDFDAHVLLRI